MSLHYLLDGYNILKKIASLRDLPLEDGRRGFLRWIDQGRPQGSVNNQVTVIFDGHPDHGNFFVDSYAGNSSKAYDIRVIFSDGCSADDLIKRMIDDDGNIKNCVVVSDDKDVFLYARSQGARVMTVAAFTGKSQSRAVSYDSVGKYLSLSGQEKINKELVQIWLKKGKT